MKFYLCQSATGPRYARTQADAKALDPAFKLVNFETDQASLVDRFNALLDEGRMLDGTPPQGIRINGVPATAEDVIAIGRELDAEDGAEAPQSPIKRRKDAEATSATDWGLAPPEGSCERCTAMSAASRDIEGIMAATNIEWSLHHADAKFLDRIAKAIGERREELARG